MEEHKRKKIIKAGKINAEIGKQIDINSLALLFKCINHCLIFKHLIFEKYIEKPAIIFTSLAWMIVSYIIS